MTRSRDGVDLAYTTHPARGDSVGPTVVLVHGWLGNRTYWDAQLEALTARHEVIALDLGGHGESGEGRPDWNLPAFGDDVVAVVNDADPERVVLVGLSMGGDAVLFAARELGDRVACVVWVDAFRSLGQEQPASPEAVEAFVAPFRDDFDATIDQFVRRLLPTADQELVVRVAGDMKKARREVALGSIGYALNREPAILAALPAVTAPVVALNPLTAPRTSTPYASTASSRSCSKASGTSRCSKPPRCSATCSCRPSPGTAKRRIGTRPTQSRRRPPP
jgi:pimeloyl-ACP methyl ester carboxylesterase